MPTLRSGDTVIMDTRGRHTGAALLRRAAARTRDALWNTGGPIVDLFTPTECQNLSAAAGHECN